MKDEVPGYLMEEILYKRFNYVPDKTRIIKNMGIAYAEIFINMEKNNIRKTFNDKWEEFVQMNINIPDNLVE